MESKIINSNKNLFLEREEISLEIKNESAPSFEDVKKEVGKDESLVVVKNIKTSFGKHVFDVEVMVYDSVESKERVETIPQKIRKKMEADKKAAEEAKAKAKEEEAKAAEEAKAKASEEAAEAPAEEKKEEVVAAEEPKTEEVNGEEKST